MHQVWAHKTWSNSPPIEHFGQRRRHAIGPEQLADQSTAHQALNIGLDAVHTTQNSVHGEISVWHVRARAIGRKADCASGVGRRDDQAIS